MDFSSYETLQFERNDRVLTVILDGVGPANGVNEQMHIELARVFHDLNNDLDSDVIVLTGKGRAFCAGADMRFFEDMVEDPKKFRAILPDARRIINGLLELEKPLVCRMNGAAAGFGASIALMSDIIIADERAKIGDPHVKAGLVAGDGGAVIWPQLIGYARAKEYLLTGRLLTAAEAAEMGMINYAVPAEELDAKVDGIVQELLSSPRWAVRYTKTAINIPLRELATKITDAAVAYEMYTNLLVDRKEAVAAFQEKRPMNLTGE
ncbi:MAG: enoyl-CoA hydratase-related protein [Pseudomonadales bacterium]|nr:enoyl-CoA hydratase-related protein [Pseudomonadales bacterium]